MQKKFIIVVKKKHSLYKERFFIIGNQWIAIMEDTNILNRTYHHVAFKISDSDVESYLSKIKTLNLELKPPRERVAGEGYSIYFYDYDNNLFELHTETLEKRLSSYTEIDSKQIVLILIYNILNKQNKDVK